METNKTFKCKDEILLKHKEDKFAVWFYAVFSHYCKNNSYITISGGTIYNLDFYKILPYKGNEELVGTTNESEEEVKLEEGERCIFSDILNLLQKGKGVIDTFENIGNFESYGERFKTFDTVPYTYCIKFSDYNPNNMEETRKHILCVKNGKIIRYKG